MPTAWERRITRIWLVLSVAWVGLFPLALVVATDDESLRAWLADPAEPGWVWLVAPPLALGIALRIAAGTWHAMLRRSALYWDDLPGRSGRAAGVAARAAVGRPEVGPYRRGEPVNGRRRGSARGDGPRRSGTVR
jgi:hypothetical protein